MVRSGQSSFKKLRIARELVSFFWRGRFWWLVPMLVLLLVFGFLIIFGQSSVIAPFIYTLF